MNNLKRLPFVIILFFLLDLPATAHGQSDTRPALLKLDIRTNKKCFSRRENVRVFVTLKNQNEDPVFIYRKKGSDYLRGLEILVFNSRGVLTRGRDPIDPNIWFKPQPDDFIKIKPHQNYQTIISFTPSDMGVAGEGILYLQASYQSPVTESIIPASLRREKISIYDDIQESVRLEIRTENDCGR